MEFPHSLQGATLQQLGQVNNWGEVKLVERRPTVPGNQSLAPSKCSPAPACIQLFQRQWLAAPPPLQA